MKCEAKGHCLHREFHQHLAYSKSEMGRINEYLIQNRLFKFERQHSHDFAPLGCHKQGPTQLNFIVNS